MIAMFIGLGACALLLAVGVMAWRSYRGTRYWGGD